jgi:phosphatidylglycerol:prolipoprotein diacylglycerol transferase
MIDEHLYPLNWGVKPILFNIGGFEVQSYAFFVLLALVVGILIYYYEARKQKKLGENTFYIALAALIGGVIGAKLPIWIINFREIIESFPDIAPFLSGRTIVGGLLGGLIAVILFKKIAKINDKRGNLFAPAIAIGVAIGRIGCFLRGCCYGKATSLPWGVDFGDGVLRHPTQIYESLFMIGMFVYITSIKKKVVEPGKLLIILFTSYFIFRFFIEFIRVEPVIFLGLTGFQIVSVIAIIYLNRGYLTRFINKIKVN